MSEIKIDKGVPMPTKYPWKSMEIGDSFVFPYRPSNKGLYRCAAHAGIKISIRKEGDGIRIWRIA